METQSEDKTSGTKSRMPMHAYVIMLHPCFSRAFRFRRDARSAIPRTLRGTYYISILAYIVNKIEQLEEKWGERIPQITALVFNSDGSASKWTCEILTGDKDVQPTARQIAKLAASVVAYDKWDKVLEALRP